MSVNVLLHTSQIYGQAPLSTGSASET